MEITIDKVYWTKEGPEFVYKVTIPRENGSSVISGTAKLGEKINLKTEEDKDVGGWRFFYL